MATPPSSTGTFQRLPYIRIGSGPAPLVVLPGLALGDASPGGLAVAAYARGFRRLAEGRTLYVVERPRALPADTTTADLADEYAAALGAELGAFDLMGLSTGGLIAQHLVLGHPDTVSRLALVVTGARLAPAGREICRRWLDLAAARRWRALHGDLAAAAVDGPVLRRIARTLGALSAKAPSAVAAADFAITVSAVLAHDTRELLPALRTPTLVLGGGVDPFFPAAVLAETADAIPDATLRVFPRDGHGVPKQRAGRMQQAVADFLGAGQLRR